MIGSKSDILNVCFCFNDTSGSYYKHALVSLVSVFENTKSPIRAHLICDETLSQQARDSFQNMTARYKHELIIYSAPEIPRAVGGNVRALFGVGSLYRLFMPELIQERSALYLDCDTICTMDVSEIFATVMDELPAAGARDPGQSRDAQRIRRMRSMGIDPDTYINSGVILFNLNLIRQKYPDYKESIFTAISREKYKYPDQDALNMYFHNNNINVCIMPEAYNYLIGQADRAYEDISSYAGKILHYTRDKPWDKFYTAAILYWKYYAVAFSCEEAFQQMEHLGKHEHAYLFNFLLRNPKMRRMVNRARQISEEGALEMLLDRLVPSRKRKKRLLSGKD